MCSPPQLPRGLVERRVVAILRGCPFPNAVAMAGAAIEAGLGVLEVTLDSERALDQLAAISSAYPTAEMGVGSVLRADQVQPAIEAGARFVVSPVVDVATIDACRDQGIAVIPGAATPTEINRALEAGATAVKIFPIEHLGGPNYLRSILSPLGRPPLIPTGGVDSDNLGQYLDSGAIAVGIGGGVFPVSALRQRDVTVVSQLSRAIVEAIE